MKFIIANLIQNFMILIIKHNANLNQVQVDEIFFVHNKFFVSSSDFRYKIVIETFIFRFTSENTGK